MNTTVDNNRKIYAFMGGKWEVAQNISSHSIQVFDGRFESYEECKVICDKVNIEKSGSPRKISFAQPVPTIGGYKRELKYHQLWGWLMPVVEKIQTMENGTYGFTIDPWSIEIIEYASGKEESLIKLEFDIDDKLIDRYYETVIAFIDYYNSINISQP